MSAKHFRPALVPGVLTLAIAMTCSTLVQAQGNPTRAEAETNPRAAAAETTQSAREGEATRPASPAQNTRALDNDEVPTDGQILQIVRTLNMGEIAQAELALDKSDSAEVKEVAEMIIADHTSSNEQIETLEEEGEDLDLDDSDTSDALANLAEETREGLADLSDAEFDCAYLQKQVDQHQLALTTVGTNLMPAAQDAQVKAFLSMSTPKLEHHLAMAQGAQEGLSGCESTLPQSNNAR